MCYALASMLRRAPRNTGATNLTSPNSARILRNHRLPHFAAPGFLEFRHVLHHSVDAVFARAVRIDRHQSAREFGAAFLAPDSSETQEEALLGGVAIDFFAGLAGLVLRDHLLERGQRDAGA